LLELVQQNANRLRVVVDVVNAITAASLYAIARPLAGPGLALVAPALWVAFLPVYPGEFASFNVPYPAWFATAAWMAVAIALQWLVTRGRLLHVALAGLAAAFAFAIKPNAGAFAITAATWSVVCATRIKGTLDRALGVLAALVMALGVWFAFGLVTWGSDALVHLVPLAVMTLLVCGPAAGRYGSERHPRTSVALVVLASAFLLPTLLWTLPVLAKLGVAGFAREVLLIGSDAAALYYEGHPPPEPFAIVVVAALMALVAGGALVRSWLVSPLTLVVIALIAAAGLASMIWRNALMPETAVLSISLQLENAAYWLAPLVNYTGIVMLAASVRRLRPAGDEGRLAVLVACAVAMYWQLYPRTDFMHVVGAVPLAVVLGAWLLARVGEWWSEGAWPDWIPISTFLSMSIAALVGAVVTLEVAPMIVSGVRCLAGGAYVIDRPKLHVCVEPEVGDDLAAFDATAKYLASNANNGEPVLPFPAVAGVLFAADLTSPVPHDYWYPGRPSREDEAHMLAAMRTSPPRFIVTLNTGWTFFIDAPEFFLAAHDFATSGYRLVARNGRFDVLARRDISVGLPLAITEISAATADQAADAWLPARRQAARRWMAHITPEEAAAAELPDDPRKAILLLRALRDGGDLKGVGWLLAGYSSTSPRIRREAASAMERVSQEFEASSHRWAGDFDVDLYRRFAQPYAAAARTLAGSSEEGPRKLAAIMAALTQGDPAAGGHL
jgi:hypothetical protein